MEVTSKVKVLIVEKGYNSLSDFSQKEKISYHLLRKLAHNQAKSIDIQFLVDLCEKLDCQVQDLLVLKK